MLRVAANADGTAPRIECFLVKPYDNNVAPTNADFSAGGAASLYKATSGTQLGRYTWLRTYNHLSFKKRLNTTVIYSGAAPLQNQMYLVLRNYAGGSHDVQGTLRVRFQG